MLAARIAATCQTAGITRAIAARTVSCRSILSREGDQTSAARGRRAITLRTIVAGRADRGRSSPPRSSARSVDGVACRTSASRKFAPVARRTRDAGVIRRADRAGHALLLMASAIPPRGSAAAKILARAAVRRAARKFLVAAEFSLGTITVHRPARRTITWTIAPAAVASGAVRAASRRHASRRRVGLLVAEPVGKRAAAGSTVAIIAIAPPRGCTGAFRRRDRRGRTFGRSPCGTTCASRPRRRVTD